MVAKEPEPLFWERQPGETNAAYQAFALYRDMGITRSLRKVVNEHFGGSSGKLRQVEEWSRNWLWVSRAEAYDAEQDKQRRLAREEQAKDARDRALEGAQLLQRVARKGLHSIEAGRVSASGEYVGPVLSPPATLLRYLRAGIELEFISLGLPINVIREEVEESAEGAQDRQRIEQYRQAREVIR